MIDTVISQDLLLVKVIKLSLRVTKGLHIPPRVGRPFTYPPQLIVACLLVMVAKRLTVRGLHAFLANPDNLESRLIRRAIPFPEAQLPNRRTFDRRFKGSLAYLPLVMLLVVTFLRQSFHLGIARLSLDNRMFAAVGGIWHKKDRQQGVIPQGLRNVDTTAGWGCSHYRGWVFGHALDMVVTTGKLVIPVIAWSRSLVTRGNSAAWSFVHLLPKVKKGVVAADSEYFDQKLHRLLKINGRSLHAPHKRYPDQTPQSATYRKRKTTVEPFFERFLQAFGLRDKLDRKGPQAWSYLVTCCLLYQLMVTLNLLEQAHAPLEVTHLIRML